MRIIIDIQSLQTESRFRGIGNYAYGLLKQIISINREHEIIVIINNYNECLVNEVIDVLSEDVNCKKIKVFSVLDKAVEIDSYGKSITRISELLRESFLASLEPDFVLILSLFEWIYEDHVCSISRNLPYKVGIIGYDLIPLIDKKSYLPTEELEQWYCRKLESVRNADFIYTISNSVKQEFSDFLGIDKNKIINISSSCLSDFKKLPLESLDIGLKLKYKINDEFILYSGTADARKNLKGLLCAFSKIKHHSYQLLLVGRYTDRERELLFAEAKALGLKNNAVCFSGFVSTEDLVQLYNQCKIFIFPSFHEGFGLPALEAMSCGAVTITSNVTSLPEVMGLKDAMFDPYDVDEIAEKLSLALENKAYRELLLENAKERSQLFENSSPAKRLMSHIEENVKKKTYSSSGELDYKNLLKKITAIINSHNLSDDIIRNIAKCISDNKNEQQLLNGIFKKQLFVDISELVKIDAKTGIQRVTRSILMNLVENPPTGYRVEPVYANRVSQGYFYAHKFLSKILGFNDERIEDYPIEYVEGDIFLGLDYQADTVSFQYKTLEEIYRAGVSILFVVYDLLPFYHSEYFVEGTKPVFVNWLKTISYFTGCLCISNATVNDLRRWQMENLETPPLPTQSAFFHLGNDIEKSMPTRGGLDGAEEVLRRMVKRPTILMVSTVEPRKRHEQALDAFELLWKNNIDINLVIVGKKGWSIDSLANRIEGHLENGKRLFWLQGISDDYLQKVYEASTVCLMASVAEGFGLMLIEAARYAKPIIVRDIEVFREIAGDHAHYFTGFEGKDLADSILEWLELYGLGGHPSTKNMKTLTWKESTHMLLDAMFSILEKQK